LSYGGKVKGIIRVREAVSRYVWGDDSVMLGMSSLRQAQDRPERPQGEKDLLRVLASNDSMEILHSAPLRSEW